MILSEQGACRGAQLLCSPNFDSVVTAEEARFVYFHCLVPFGPET